VQQLPERPDNARQPGQTGLVPEEGEYSYPGFEPMSPGEIAAQECATTPSPQPVVQVAPEVKSSFGVVAFLVSFLLFLIVLAMVLQWAIFHL
jgi:hypothetical protein